MKKATVLMSLFFVFGLFISKVSIAQFEGVIYFDKVKTENYKKGEKSKKHKEYLY